MQRPRLILVYNADSGGLNLALDIAHKIISPSTYACRLCALSHGYFHMHASWKAFLASLPLEVKALHRDEYLASTTQPQALPLVLLQTGEESHTLLDAEAIKACESLEALQQKILEKLSSPSEK